MEYEDEARVNKDNIAVLDAQIEWYHSNNVNDEETLDKLFAEKLGLLIERKIKKKLIKNLKKELMKKRKKLRRQESREQPKLPPD